MSEPRETAHISPERLQQLIDRANELERENARLREEVERKDALAHALADQIKQLSASLTSERAAREKAEKRIAAALDYLSDYEDVRDGSDGRQMPNTYMEIGMMLRGDGPHG